MTVNVKEIAEYIASTENISKVSAERIVRGTFDYIKSMLAEGADINISDFGKFTVETRAARTGRNPATGETIEIAEKQAVKFKAHKSLRADVQF